VVAKRLRELDVTAEQIIDKNGIWPPDRLLRAVTFTDRKEVKSELLDIFRRTVHSDCALAVLPAIPRERNTEILAKMKLFLKAVPAVEEHWHGDGYALLNAIGERFPDHAANVLAAYVKDGSAQRRTTLCHVLREKWGAKLAERMLTPYLHDRDEAYKESYSLRPVRYNPRLPLRICDEAALTIAQHNKAVSFKLAGTHSELDRQIQEIIKTYKNQANQEGSAPN
jgi:hypothetical protein